MINCFTQVGLTDAAIAEVSKLKYLVLTDDLPLFGLLQSRGIDAVNSSHIRLLPSRHTRFQRVKLHYSHFAAPVFPAAMLR